MAGVSWGIFDSLFIPPKPEDVWCNTRNKEQHQITCLVATSIRTLFSQRIKPFYNITKPYVWTLVNIILKNSHQTLCQPPQVVTACLKEELRCKQEFLTLGSKQMSNINLSFTQNCCHLLLIPCHKPPLSSMQLCCSKCESGVTAAPNLTLSSAASLLAQSFYPACPR